MSKVTLDSPPPEGRRGRQGRYDWDSIVETLQSQPGVWLLVAEGASKGLPNAIKRRKMVALQDPAWDYHVVTRNNDAQAGTGDVWMAAVPAEEEK